MADQRITQLTALSEAALAATDVLPIADISASETKKITAKDLVEGAIALADSGSIDLAKLDQSSATKLGTTALADDSVTYAKLQNVSATDKLLGRSTAGAGDVEEITLTAAGRALLDDADAATQRATLGLGTIATQAASAVAITGGTISGGTITGITDLAIADGGTGASTAANARTNLGVAIGTDVQAQDAGLQSIAGLTTGADQTIYTTASDTYAVASLTAYGRSLIDDADAATARATLGLGTLATQTGTVTGTHSGTSSGTNTGDQTITLTGDVTGTGTGSFAATIANEAVTSGKIAAGAVTANLLAADSVTDVKLADNSSVVVAGGVPVAAGVFIGQQWVNANTGFEYTWTGSEWKRLHGIATLAFNDTTPLAFAVTYPDDFSAAIGVTLDTQAASAVFVGPASGANAAPTFRSLVPDDLPNATAVAKGVIQPGTGLAVSAGVLNHANSVAGATLNGITFDSQGHITNAAALAASDIPSLDTSKITTGTFATAFIADNAVNGFKLADYATAQFGETLPVADYIGQIFFNPLDKAFFLWDGNVWQPIGISAGQIIFAGTFDASSPSGVGKVASVTPEGAAAGFTVNGALPASAPGNNKHYLVVSEGGTITSGNAPNVALAPPDLILSVYSATSPAWVEVDVSSGAGAIAASQVSFASTADVASSNVQTAIEEVSTECRNATNITSGTLAVARGGTGLASYTKGDLIVASGSTTLAKLPVGTNTHVLRANSATATGLEWGADFVGTVTTVSSSTAALTVATATTTPALTVRSATTSVDGIVQLSDSTNTTSSVLAATPTAVKAAYDLAAAALPKAGGVVTGALEIGSSGSLVFEGSTDDAFETTLDAADATADRTITLPNVTGTVITTGDTGTVTSTMLLDGTILNADINASAAIAGTKISPDFGSQTIVTTGVHSAAAGSATTPSIAFTGDLNTGIYSLGADQLAVSTGGTGRLFVDASGNVGIGTSSPGGKLEILQDSTANTTPAIRITGSAGDPTNYYMEVVPSLSGSLVNYSFNVKNVGTYSDVLCISGSGNVGIGTTSPTTTLDVNGDVKLTSLELGNTSDTTLSRSAAGVLAVEGVVVPTISSTNTLTNKTLTDPAIVGTILEDVFTITDGAAFEVDPGNGSVQLITLGAARTPKSTNFAAGESITLMVDDGTANTLTWTDATWGSGGVKWVGGTAPTLATTGYTVIQFWKVSTQVYGALVGNVA